MIYEMKYSGIDETWIFQSKYSKRHIWLGLSWPLCQMMMPAPGLVSPSPMSSARPLSQPTSCPPWPPSCRHSWLASPWCVYASTRAPGLLRMRDNDSGLQVACAPAGALHVHGSAGPVHQTLASPPPGGLVQAVVPVHHHQLVITTTAASNTQPVQETDDTTNTSYNIYY